MTEVAGTTRASDNQDRPSAVLTFLLADIRGYTRYSAEQGDQAAARISELFLTVCGEVVTAHGGDVFGQAGDQALVAFTSAHAALDAALHLQTRLEAEQAAHPHLPLTAGIGLDTGEGVRAGRDYRGNAINLAARLCSLAGGGEIFASETVIHVARKVDGLAVVDRGEVTLKGLAHPVRVVQIAAEGSLPDALPPLQPILVTHPTNLPDEMTPFIGRSGEITQVVSLLGRTGVRLVTLLGPGGTGKTRLALQVGMTVLYSFRDGVYFCDLAPLTDAALVPSAIAHVLGIKEEEGTEVLTTLAERLEAKQLLLVLDNFEHLQDACTAVAHLLEVCRELHILVTSRIPLHLTREHEYPVAPLSLPDLGHLPTPEVLSQYEAVALFIERASAVKPGFVVTNENAPAVAEVCVRLDGLPLAIELAAVRVRVFPPQALLQRLSGRLTLLTGGARDRPSRQQTLRGAIDWSHSLLNAPEQTLFARLSVFVGGCTLEAAEAVCTAEGDLAIEVLDGIQSLVEKSLLGQEEGAQGEPRFVMLETIHEYASEKAEEHGETEALRAAHAAYFCRLADEAEPELEGPEPWPWLDRLEGELANVRLALRSLLEQGAAQEELRLVGALRYLFHVRGYWSERSRWLEEGLAAAGEAVAPEVRAKALLQTGSMAGNLRDFETATSVLEEALGLFRELADRRGVAGALDRLGSVAISQGQRAQAAHYYEESIRLWGELGNQVRLGYALNGMGRLAKHQGDLAGARQRFGEALSVFRAFGQKETIAVALLNLGTIAILEGDLLGAESSNDESLSLSRKVGLKGLIASALENAGVIARMRGQFAVSAERLRESLLMAREIGVMPFTFEVIGEFAMLAVAQGHCERGTRLAGAAAAFRESIDMPLPLLEQAMVEEAIGRVRTTIGDQAFTRLWKQGRAMTLEDAVALALEPSGSQP